MVAGYFISLFKLLQVKVLYRVGTKKALTRKRFKEKAIFNST